MYFNDYFWNLGYEAFIKGGAYSPPNNCDSSDKEAAWYAGWVYAYEENQANLYAD